MADLGDKVSVRSKAGPRIGVVTAVNGSMLRVRWEDGAETSIAPGPGVLAVVGKSRGARTAKAAPVKAAPVKAVRRKAAPRKAAAPKKTPAATARTATRKKAASPVKRANKKPR